MVPYPRVIIINYSWAICLIKISRTLYIWSKKDIPQFPILLPFIRGSGGSYIDIDLHASSVGIIPYVRTKRIIPSSSTSRPSPRIIISCMSQVQINYHWVPFEPVFSSSFFFFFFFYAAVNISVTTYLLLLVIH